MNSILKTVALVGRPNVGKSRLFNRLVKKRISIVHDQAGVTRDIIVAEVDQHFVLMDTGGLGLDSGENNLKVIDQAVREQADLAIQAADLIVFVVDGRGSCTPLDTIIAKKLKEYGKQVILVVNKVDHPKNEDDILPFYQLGFGEPLGISAEHNLQIDTLLEKISTYIGPPPAEGTNEAKSSQEPARMKICFAGRPNVGKSSLANALLKTERLIVSDVPGTTRESVRIHLDYTAKDQTPLHFCLIDTAGLRHNNKISTSVEKFSSFRTQQAIEETDLVFLVLDAKEGVTQLDKKLVSTITELGKGLIIIVNKWDIAIDQFKNKGGLEGYENLQEFREKFETFIRDTIFSLPQIPIFFTSAKEGYALPELLEGAAKLYKKMQAKLPTGPLNRTLKQIMERKGLSFKDGRHFKVYYVLQTSFAPLKLRLYCNQAVKMNEPYKRYLENSLTTAFGLEGCPILFELVGKPKRPRAPSASSPKSQQKDRRSHGRKKRRS